MEEKIQIEHLNNNSDSSGKIKLLLIVRWPVGGIRSYIRYVYQNFEPELYHLTILGPQHPELDLLSSDIKSLDVNIIKLSSMPSSYEFIKVIIMLLSREKFDLVHSQGLTAGVCAALPAFIFGCPHIVTPHEMLNKGQFSGAVGKLKKIGMSIALSFVKTIQCVSCDARDNLMEYLPILANNKDKCTVIRNGIEVGKFIDVEPRALREELGVSEDVYLIGFLGRFMPVKGFVFLVDAIEELSKTRTLPRFPLVVTFGEGAFIREEKTQITKRGLDEYFRFLPFTTNVAETIKALDVVVMPSLSEACPLLAMEVLVAGTPLIATNCIGLREIVKNTPAFTLPPANGKKLADSLEYFINNDQKEIFGTFSSKAASMFDVDFQTSKMKSIIMDCINN